MSHKRERLSGAGEQRPNEDHKGRKEGGKDRHANPLTVPLSTPPLSIRKNDSVSGLSCKQRRPLIP